MNRSGRHFSQSRATNNRSQSMSNIAEIMYRSHLHYNAKTLE